MNDTCTICHSYICIAIDKESLLVLLFSFISSALVKRLILFVLKICTNICLKNFVSLLALFLSKAAKYVISKSLCKIICLKILYLLDKACLLFLLTKEQKDYKHLSKPGKIFLGNGNLMYALSSTVNLGTCRETFFANQLSAIGDLTMPEKGDFLLDNRYLFEVGGSSKDFRQIANIPDSYLAVDDVEMGHQNRIPLWMFGLMY